MFHRCECVSVHFLGRSLPTTETILDTLESTVLRGESKVHFAIFADRRLIIIILL